MDYTKYLSKNASEIKPSGIRKFFDIVSELKDAISLGVGEPDFDTPWVGRSYSINSIRKGYTHYTSNRGLKQLRELIVRYYSERFSLDYSAEKEALITVGGSEAIDCALRAIVNPGDEVAIPDPSFVCYSPCITLCGGVPVHIKCNKATDFKITPESLQKVITSKTKAIILSYPNNPTGAVMNKHDYELIAPLIIKHDLIVISDEIYAELTYGDKHVSPALIEGMKERTIVVSGFSKAFAMTGWRLGYSLAPEPITNVMHKIHQYAIMCAPTASQYAGIACLDDCFKNDFSVIKEMRDEYDRRRRFLVNGLKNIGIDCIKPQGAFYVFADVSSLGMNGDEFSDRLLRDELVAVVPGSAFGECGTNFVRISYASSVERISKALKRIEKFINKIKE